MTSQTTNSTRLRILAALGLLLLSDPASSRAQETGEVVAPAPGATAQAAPASAPAPSYAAPAPAPAPAPEAETSRPPQTPGVFARNRIRVGVLLGSGYTGNDRYLILGAGVGYYLINGLEVSLDYQAWVVGSPTYHRLTPSLTYAFWMVPKIKPYLGVFYRHTWAQGLNDYSSMGVRGGIYIVPQGPVFFGVGIVYERALDCDDAVNRYCDDYYPEIMVGVSLGR